MDRYRNRFDDTRWAMNRMTAHLAIASAVRGQEQAGIDADLAGAILLIFKGRQTGALDALSRLDQNRPSGDVAAWTRALRLRITQNVRTIDAPAAASLLEKREYFRAHRATVRSVTAQLQLEALQVEPDADWFRTMETYGLGVEDGGMITEGLDWERAEYEGVFRRIHGRDIADDPSEALNTRASRAIGPAGPGVLPWGAWAEMAQRHLALFATKSDNFYRHLLGSAERADTQKRLLKHDLQSLAMFPIASIFWTRGVRGGDADLTLINEAIDARTTRFSPATT